MAPRGLSGVQQLLHNEWGEEQRDWGGRASDRRERARGGASKPPDPSSRVTQLTDVRISWLVRQSRKGFPDDSLGQMAARWGVTPRRLYQLLQLSRQMGGGIPLLNPHRRPKAPPLTEEEKEILRQEWARSPRGATLLWRELKHRGIQIPKMKIYGFARSQGWTLANPRKQKRRKWVRYEREHSGSLLHGDFHRTSESHPHCILWEDDASRMLLGGGEFPAQSSAVAIATLEASLQVARRWNLRVQEVLTDRGAEFFVTPAKSDGRREGENAFQVYLRSQGIRHVVARVNHPQTNGKLERLWKEYDRHRWRYATLEEWIDWYNSAIHSSLWELECPREAFQRKLPPESLLGLHERLVDRILEEAVS